MFCYSISYIPVQVVLQNVAVCLSDASQWLHVTDMLKMQIHNHIDFANLSCVVAVLFYREHKLCVLWCCLSKGNGGMAPLIICFGARLRRVVSFTLCPLYSGKSSSQNNWTGRREINLICCKTGGNVFATRCKLLPKLDIIRCCIKYKTNINVFCFIF